MSELVEHHVGGYLKIAPEHTEAGPLSKMMKPGIGAYDRFKAMFDAAAKAGKKEYFLIPYFIAAHPGTTDEDMMNLALWLKRNRYRADQVQTFLPSPMALSTAMYHTGFNPLKPVRRGASETVDAVKGLRQRRLHKAFLRYHDPENWPLLREALKAMGRADLIGPGPRQLVPGQQPRSPQDAARRDLKDRKPGRWTIRDPGRATARTAAKSPGLVIAGGFTRSPASTSGAPSLAAKGPTCQPVSATPRKDVRTLSTDMRTPNCCRTRCACRRGTSRRNCSRRRTDGGTP